jgi:predicted Zn-dependent peptidase
MPRRFSVHTFENGLTAIIEFLPQAVSTAVGFHIRTGARDEVQKLDGVSHFLEHMMFKGTEKRGWQEINRDFDQMGARYNAFTSWEETCYYAWVLKEEEPRALELLSDMLNPTLPEDEFQTERKVILEEIARYNDMPDHVAFEQAMRIAFAGHRLSSNILGSAASIKRMQRAEMLDYLKRRYAPSNVTLFVCGNVDEAKMLAHIEELWSGRTGPRAERTSPTPQFRNGFKMIQKKNVARQNMVFLWPTLPITDKRSTVASLLGNILGDDRSSRLYWALRHTGLCDEAGGGYWGFTDCGLMAVQTSCDPEKTPQVEKIVRAELKKLKKGVKPIELQRAKNRALTSLVFSAETPFNRFRQLMHQWTVRRELLTPEAMKARVEAVTLQDIHQLIEDYPFDTPGVVVGLGPLKDLKPANKTAPAKKKPARAALAKK